MRSTDRSLSLIERLREEIEEADAVVIGAGAGLSASAGYRYDGPLFRDNFADFAEKYGFRDLYSASFGAFECEEEKWAFWSRLILLCRYGTEENAVYKNLLKLAEGKEYFVITTNVDHWFQRTHFDKKRLFYTQGDYGLFQCSVPCRAVTYDNEEAVREMAARQQGMKIPKELIPRCPVCGRPMSMNLRADDTFVEDEGWHAACAAYEAFLAEHRGEQILFLELGVGYNTPTIIKIPFWRMTLKNPLAVYACVNRGQAAVPRELEGKSICLDADIGAVLERLVGGFPG